MESQKKAKEMGLSEKESDQKYIRNALEFFSKYHDNEIIIDSE